MEQTPIINFEHFNSLTSIVETFTSDSICKAVIAQERWGMVHAA